MRRSILVLALLALATVGYLAWPAYSVARLARAVETRDYVTVIRHVNVPAVRRSLTDQVLETYLKLTGKTGSPLLRGVVVSAAGSIADPIVVKMTSPDALTELLRTGWPSGVLADPPPGVSGLTTANLGSVWRIYSVSSYGLRRFEIEVPQSAPRDRRYGLEFQISNWRWRLTAVRLPEHLRIRLAELLIKLSKP